MHARRLLIATLIPPVALCAGIGGPNVAFLGLPLSLTGAAEAGLTITFVLLGVALALAAFGLLGSFVMIAVYIVDIARRPSLTRDARLGWILAVLFGWFIGMLAYWYVVVRAEATTA